MEIEIFKKYTNKGIEVVRWNNKSGEVKIVFIDKETKAEVVKQVYTINK